MKTLKLAVGTAVIVFLVGWRVRVAVGNLDPQLYVSVVQDVPNLVFWVKASLVAIVVGFLIIVGYAIKNELDAESDRQKQWTDMRQHVTQELTASITRSVKSYLREREEGLDDWQGKLETVDKELQERYQIVMAREQVIEARVREVDTAKAEVMPLRYGYEDGRATLDSLIEVTRADHADTLKVLDKALKWVMMATEDPEKFISEAKADRVNTGWLERLQRKLQNIEVRAEGTKQAVEQIYEAVSITERQQRKEVKL